MSSKARWQQIAHRSWAEIGPVWVDVAATVPPLLRKPEPGLEKLSGLVELGRENLGRFEDVVGLRRQVFWEAVFLFAKCDHAKIASERLANIGMASWAMFNAYHSAYLGARGILWMLGVPLPDLAGRQVVLDLFPEEDPKARKRRGLRPLDHQEFLLKHVGKLDQRAIWDCLKRVIRISDVGLWGSELVAGIDRLDESSVTPPRNHFLYKAGYWVFDDLERDLPIGYEWMDVSNPISPSDKSFLLWLCFTIHKLLLELFNDLGQRSKLIETYVSSTRTVLALNSPLEAAYKGFCAAI